MKNKIFFILGIRRSGTSLLRRLMDGHPEVGANLFEPHDLWHAIQMKHMPRIYNDWHEKKIKEFLALGKNRKWIGFKMPLNPGVTAFDWKWLPKEFPKSKIIFIFRDMLSTYQSYQKVDANTVRGTIKDSYFLLFQELQKSMKDFHSKNSKRSCVVSFKNLVLDPDKEMKKVWNLLNISHLTGLEAKIEPPEHWPEEKKR